MSDTADALSFWDRETSRGQVLKGTAGLAGAALAAGVGLPGGGSGVEAAHARTNAEPPRSYGMAFVLRLGEEMVGSLKSVQGGGARAEVVEEPGDGGTSKKQVAGIRYDEIVIETGLRAPIVELIANSWLGKSEPINGAIIRYDLAGVAKEELQFRNAVLTETTFPSLDASSKDAGYLTLALQPEETHVARGDGSKPPVGSKQKAWLVSNFRFELDGLDGTRVNKIDRFTVRRELLESARAFEPGKLEVPDLRLSFSAASESSWRKWERSFLLAGEFGDESEKTGEITLLAPDLKAVLARLSLHHVGLINLSDQKQVANTETIPRMQAELYVERMDFTPGRALG